MKKFFKWASVVTLILVSIWFILDYGTAAVLHRACDKWPLLNTNLANMSQVFPTTCGSQSAKELRNLYQQIDLTSHNSDSESNTKLVEKIRKYLQNELSKPVAAINVPPAFILTALQENNDILDKIVNLLVSGDLPVFPLDVEVEPWKPIAMTSWYIYLNRLLVVNALVLTQVNNDIDNAWLSLHAAARLADALFMQPSLLSQMFAKKQTNNILLAMRKMPAPVPMWALNWPKDDISNKMLLGFTGEARGKLTMAEKSDLISIIDGMGDIYQDFGLEPVKIAGARFLYICAGRPYLRLFSSYQILAIKKIIQQRLREGLCVATPSQLPALKESIPHWLPGGKKLMNLLSMADLGLDTDLYSTSWNSLYLTLIYRAGTQVIMRAKMVKAETADMGWPREVPDLKASCEYHSWSYTLESDGSAIFEYEKPIPKGGVNRTIESGYLKYIGDTYD